MTVDVVLSGGPLRSVNDLDGFGRNLAPALAQAWKRRALTNLAIATYPPKDQTA